LIKSSITNKVTMIKRSVFITSIVLFVLSIFSPLKADAQYRIITSGQYTKRMAKREINRIAFSYKISTDNILEFKDLGDTLVLIENCSTEDNIQNEFLFIFSLIGKKKVCTKQVIRYACADCGRNMLTSIHQNYNLSRIGTRKWVSSYRMHTQLSAIESGCDGFVYCIIVEYMDWVYDEYKSLLENEQ
jgi:hypothetical protein